MAGNPVFRLPIDAIRPWRNGVSWRREIRIIWQIGDRFALA
jgi:hypothetical protein